MRNIPELKCQFTLFLRLPQPTTMSGSLKWVEYVCYGISIVVMLLTLLRLYIRYVAKSLGFDDWLILFSACLILGSCISVGLMFRQAGIGVRASNPSDNQVSLLGQILLSFQILYYFAIGCVVSLRGTILRYPNHLSVLSKSAPLPLPDVFENPLWNRR
ncbi:hypothetical protein B0O99DRAFT_37135 [Bisporella sp. PMI_857]|nr:hypothetical protein B0O99DRAFT_37135 [Bisporella sp. PMI_857]